MSGKPAEEIAPCYKHDGFSDFLRHFGQIVSLFRGPDDIVCVLERHLRRLKSQGCVYAEFRVSPSVWEHFGMEPEGALDRLVNARIPGSIPYNLIVEAVRHWDRTLAERDLGLAIRHRGKVRGFGLGGDEIAAPAENFSWLAGECRSSGLTFIPHAGEVAGPGEVLKAVEMGVKRIGHGIGAAADAVLCERLMKENIHLEVCPTSNYITGAVRRGEEHPLKRLWERGVPFSVSTDDPGLFLTTLRREVRLASSIAGVGEGFTAILQENALHASLLDEREKENLRTAFFPR